jgi:hypothetical protein
MKKEFNGSIRDMKKIKSKFFSEKPGNRTEKFVDESRALDKSIDIILSSSGRLIDRKFLPNFEDECKIFEEYIKENKVKPLKRS